MVSGLAHRKTYPLVRDLAAEGFSVRLACGVLGFSAQAYYSWAKVSYRNLNDTYVINALIDDDKDYPAFTSLVLDFSSASARSETGRVTRLADQIPSQRQFLIGYGHRDR